ncbi:MAG: pyridoxal-phosphate dependent enzyme [Xanthomonadales bacterium]|nr:pyridoxal-phosphate dependent enzyme [Xanthomonadales bacterium]
MDLIFPDRIALAQRPTVLQPLPRLSKRYGKKISLWRDDLTGWEFSGNKIRKLEYLCAEAARHGADHLVTCGGPQSNHARATAFAARRLGWDITVVVREPPEGLHHNAPASGNLLLNQLLGANFLYVPYDDYQAGGGVYEPFLEKAARELTAVGARPYIIPEGGSCPTGCWGYLDATRELLSESNGETLDLFCAIGSGGTFAGLELGRELLDAPFRLHGVNICDSAGYFEQRIQGLLADTNTRYADHGVDYIQESLNIHDGFVGSGYAVASDDDLRFYGEIAREEGILLDPVYTGKAFRGMLALISEQPGEFSENIVFLHSGGQLATFAYTDQYSRILKDA